MTQDLTPAPSMLPFLSTKVFLSAKCKQRPRPLARWAESGPVSASWLLATPGNRSLTKVDAGCGHETFCALAKDHPHPRWTCWVTRSRYPKAARCRSSVVGKVDSEKTSRLRKEKNSCWEEAGSKSKRQRVLKDDSRLQAESPRAPARAASSRPSPSDSAGRTRTS